MGVPGGWGLGVDGSELGPLLLAKGLLTGEAIVGLVFMAGGCEPFGFEMDENPDGRRPGSGRR